MTLPELAGAADTAGLTLLHVSPYSTIDPMSRDPKSTERQLTGNRRKAALVMLSEQPGTKWWGFTVADKAEIPRSAIYGILREFESLHWMKTTRERATKDRRHPPRVFYEFTAEGWTEAWEAVQRSEARTRPFEEAARRLATRMQIADDGMQPTVPLARGI